MIIQKIERKNEKGELDVTFALTEEQTQLLLEFAINMLVGKGLISFTEEGKKPTQEQLELDFKGAMNQIMINTDPKDLPRA